MTNHNSVEPGCYFLWSSFARMCKAPTWATMVGERARIDAISLSSLWLSNDVLDARATLRYGAIKPDAVCSVSIAHMNQRQKCQHTDTHTHWKSLGSEGGSCKLKLVFAHIACLLKLLGKTLFAEWLGSKLSCMLDETAGVWTKLKDFARPTDGQSSN